MSELISEIRDVIDKEWLAEYLGRYYAEQLVYTDYNIEILKINIDDLKSESYENIEHIGYVENEDWDTLRNLVTEKEVKAIQEEIKEDNERYRDEYEGDSSPSDIKLNLYKAILYCNEEYVWSTTTYSFDD